MKTECPMRIGTDTLLKKIKNMCYNIVLPKENLDFFKKAYKVD